MCRGYALDREKGRAGAAGQSPVNLSQSPGVLLASHQGATCQDLREEDLRSHSADPPQWFHFDFFKILFRYVLFVFHGFITRSTCNIIYSVSICLCFNLLVFCFQANRRLLQQIVSFLVLVMPCALVCVARKSVHLCIFNVSSRFPSPCLIVSSLIPAHKDFLRTWPTMARRWYPGGGERVLERGRVAGRPSGFFGTPH